MKINRTLLLLTDLYGVLTYTEIYEQLEGFRQAYSDFSNVLSQAERFKTMLEETEQDTTDIEDKIRCIGIQLVYIKQNIETTLDALSLCEEEIVYNIYLPDTNGWGEVCKN